MVYVINEMIFTLHQIVSQLKETKFAREGIMLDKYVRYTSAYFQR